MAKPFEVVIEQELDATPEQAWEAITTGARHGWLVHGHERGRAAPRWRAPHRLAGLHDGVHDHRLGSTASLRQHVSRGPGRPIDGLRVRHRGPRRWHDAAALRAQRVPAGRHLGGRVRRPQEGRSGLHLQARGVPQVLPWPQGGPGLGMGRPGRGRSGLVGVPSSAGRRPGRQGRRSCACPDSTGCRRSTASSTTGRPTSLASARTTGSIASSPRWAARPSGTTSMPMSSRAASQAAWEAWLQGLFAEAGVA